MGGQRINRGVALRPARIIETIRTRTPRSAARSRAPVSKRPVSSSWMMKYCRSSVRSAVSAICTRAANPSSPTGSRRNADLPAWARPALANVLPSLVVFRMSKSRLIDPGVTGTGDEPGTAAHQQRSKCDQQEPGPDCRNDPGTAGAAADPRFGGTCVRPAFGVRRSAENPLRFLFIQFLLEAERGMIGGNRHPSTCSTKSLADRWREICAVTH